MPRNPKASKAFSVRKGPREGPQKDHAMPSDTKSTTEQRLAWPRRGPSEATVAVVVSHAEKREKGFTFGAYSGGPSGA